MMEAFAGRTEIAARGEHVAELRHAVRYPIKAPVVFAWQGPVGWLRGDGITRDISGKGAYIRTSTSPPTGVTVEIEIFLPPIAAGGKSMTVATSGQVIRVEHFADKEALSGFAVLGHGFGILYVGSKQN
jgi:hypothetical protein